MDPDLRTVVLFGSLATGNLGNREPDVDLAVPQYLRLVAIALDSPFKVDVIVPNASPVISRAVHGTVMYERERALATLIAER